MTDRRIQIVVWMVAVAFMVLAGVLGCTVVERNCTHEVNVKTVCAADGRAVIIHPMPR